MKIARSFAEAAEWGPCAVTIGNFDGVHAGHRSLLCTTVGVARERGLNAVALTFDPHPMAVVAPSRMPRLLTTVGERCRVMERLGLDDVVILPFTPEVACLSPEQFAGLLKHSLRAGVVVVGEDFRFGHKHSGHADTLVKLGEELGFETCVLPPVRRRGRVVSSSAVRALIEAGNVAMASRLLDSPYGLSGEVVKGHGVGSTQTVPTLNLRASAQVLPKSGVYLTRTADLDGTRHWNSITNIGHRPTFGGDAELSIETFLLEPLDGAPPANIQVDLLRRVRDEHKFADAAALKAQILRDVGRAQAFFRRVARWVRKPLE
jgi:riboflavin kinase/FMN adenylyltransferase